MNSATTKLEAVTKETVERMYRERDGRRLGIREVSLEVERAMGVECDIADIHKAVNRTCAFYPSDDPQCREAPRQRAFGWQPDWSKDPMDMRLWVLPRN